LTPEAQAAAEILRPAYGEGIGELSEQGLDLEVATDRVPRHPAAGDEGG
jgi:hypothetical protein